MSIEIMGTSENFGYIPDKNSTFTQVDLVLERAVQCAWSIKYVVNVFRRLHVRSTVEFTTDT